MRQLYLIDIELYRQVFKALLIAFNLQLKQQTSEQNSNCQEDLTALLFILLFNQVFSFEYYYESIMDSQKLNNKNKSLTIVNQFDLSFNLKISIILDKILILMSLANR